MDGVGIKSSEEDLMDFNFSFFLREMLLGKSGFVFSAPLSLKGMESGGVVVEAMAAVFRAETRLDKSFVLDKKADSILETVLVRQALAKDGSCRFVNSMELRVVAWGLEASCSGTIIGCE
jgi:hypothetical protein